MADKTTALVLDALSRAVADPGGAPLHGSKSAPGLFATTAAARQAAQRCKDEGYLRVVRTETRGKTELEICALTEKGLGHLLSETSPKKVLEDLVRTLEARQNQAGELLLIGRQLQANLDAIKRTAEKVLEQVNCHSPAPALPAPSTNGSTAWVGEALSFLGRWQAPEDCPLPELFRQVSQASPGLTIGHFHDGLRRLHDEQKIYLHPWTGPLYDLPEPPFALLIGHEIAYYASLRN